MAQLVAVWHSFCCLLAAFGHSWWNLVKTSHSLWEAHRVLGSCENVPPQKSHTIPTFILGIHCQALSMLRTSKPCTAEFPDLVRLKAVEPANIRPVPTRSNKAQNARLRSKHKKNCTRIWEETNHLLPLFLRRTAECLWLLQNSEKPFKHPDHSFSVIANPNGFILPRNSVGKRLRMEWVVHQLPKGAGLGGV